MKLHNWCQCCSERNGNNKKDDIVLTGMFKLNTVQAESNTK